MPGFMALPDWRHGDVGDVELAVNKEGLNRALLSANGRSRKRLPAAARSSPARPNFLILLCSFATARFQGRRSAEEPRGREVFNPF